MTEQSPAASTMRGITFNAFRNRGASGALTRATITFLVLAAIISGVFVFMGWGALSDYAGWVTSMAGREAGAPPEFPPVSVFLLIPLWFFYLFVIYLLFASYEASCLRWLVRGETGGFLGLTLGADMWRVWACYWAWFFVILGFYLACVVTIALFVGVGVAMDNAVFAAVIAVIAIVTSVCLFIWIAVRLAPAAAATIALRRFAFAEAWSVTKGRFWSLFGALALLTLIYFVTIKLVYVVGMMGVMGPVFLGFANRGDLANSHAFAAVFAKAVASPATLAILLVTYVAIVAITVLYYVAMFGVNARAALVARQEGRI